MNITLPFDIILYISLYAEIPTLIKIIHLNKRVYNNKNVIIDFYYDRHLVPNDNNQFEDKKDYVYYLYITHRNADKLFNDCIDVTNQFKNISEKFVNNKFIEVDDYNENSIVHEEQLSRFQSIVGTLNNHIIAKTYSSHSLFTMFLNIVCKYYFSIPQTKKVRWNRPFFILINTIGEIFEKLRCNQVINQIIIDFVSSDGKRL